jgi:membrane protein YqaA with SNARE-associated domain
MTGKPFNGIWKNLKIQHHDNRERGVYGYMGLTALKIIFLYFIIMVPLVLIGSHLIDTDRIFQYVTDNLSDGLILGIFFVSESFLGMIPPDIFMIWGTKFDSPMPVMVLLGLLSYTGGVISYLIGHWLSLRPGIRAYSERALKKYILLARKWGGAFIIISALFPFSPFSMIVIAISLLKYPFRPFLLFSIARIARFTVQGAIYAGLLNIG